MPVGRANHFGDHICQAQKEEINETGKLETSPKPVRIGEKLEKLWSRKKDSRNSILNKNRVKNRLKVCKKI